MRSEFLREKLFAGLFCLLGIGACLLMWHEAGLDRPGRRVNIFGGRRSTPFWERRYPESNIFFSGCAFAMIIVGVFGLQSQKRVVDPEILAGPSFILAGFLLGLLLYQARTVNGLALEVFQPGFYLAMAACGGIIAAGIMIIARSMYASGRSRG